MVNFFINKINNDFQKPYTYVYMPMKKNIENSRKLTWIYLWGSRQRVRGCCHTNLHICSVITCYAFV